MFLEFPDAPAYQTMDSEFMFGRSLLVAPKVVENFGPYEINLPAGVWYDFWTGRQMTGQLQTVDPPLNTLPVYVRAGAILPGQPLVQTTDEVPKGPLQLAVYPGPACEGSLYDDDGNSLAYTRGEFLRMHFTCEASSESLSLHLSAAEGTYKPWWTAIKLVFYGFAKGPREVSVGGARTSDWQYDSKAQAVTLTVAAGQSGNEVLILK
jgi:alpha-glucosidase